MATRASKQAKGKEKVERRDEGEDDSDVEVLQEGAARTAGSEWRSGG